MDRLRVRAALLAGALLLAAAAPAEPPLRLLRWLAPGADPVAAATREPAECLRKPSGFEDAYRIEVGRAAFRSPLLLGGQAARAGLSCESCHRAGRGNPEFHFSGLSGAPGTADVTASLFSSHRGDGVFNPVPIPDLAGPPETLKVAPEARRAFIRGLVVEEFDGPEPSPAVLDGLAAYVAALEPSACPGGDRAVTAAGHLEDARRAIDTAVRALDRRDPATSLAMISAARRRLGDIAERMPGEPGLRALDADLAGAAQAARSADPRQATTQLAASQADLDDLDARLTASRERTLYAPARLRQALAR